MSKTLIVLFLLGLIAPGLHARSITKHQKRSIPLGRSLQYDDDYYGYDFDSDSRTEEKYDDYYNDDDVDNSDGYYHDDDRDFDWDYFGGYDSSSENNSTYVEENDDTTTEEAPDADVDYNWDDETTEDYETEFHPTDFDEDDSDFEIDSDDSDDFDDIGEWDSASDDEEFSGDDDVDGDINVDDDVTYEDIEAIEEDNEEDFEVEEDNEEDFEVEEDNEEDFEVEEDNEDNEEVYEEVDFEEAEENVAEEREEVPVEGAEDIGEVIEWDIIDHQKDITNEENSQNVDYVEEDSIVPLEVAEEDDSNESRTVDYLEEEEFVQPYVEENPDEYNKVEVAEKEPENSVNQETVETIEEEDQVAQPATGDDEGKTTDYIEESEAVAPLNEDDYVGDYDEPIELENPEDKGDQNVGGNDDLLIDQSADPNSATLAISIRYDLPFEEFQNFYGKERFISRLSQVLGVDETYIKILSIREGSVILELEITLNDEDGKGANASEQVQQLAVTLDKAVESGNLEIFEGAKIIDYKRNIYTYARPSSIIPGPGYGFGVIISLFGILSILALVACKWRGGSSTLAKQRAYYPSVPESVNLDLENQVNDIGTAEKADDDSMY